MAKRNGISVDFTGVESGGRAVPDGEYLLEAVSIEEKESGEGNPYLAWKWKIVDGPYKGATLYDNTSLKSTALWRLKMLMECLGMDVSNGKMSIDIASFKGKTLLAKTANETYQGKEKPRITDFLQGMGSAGKSGSVSTFKKGSRVKFDFEGADMEGEVTGMENGKVIVTTEVDGTKEEWELDQSELTAR